MTTRRLDVALHEAGLARSRTHARRIIDEGRARIDGRPVTKSSAPVLADSHLEVADVPDGVEFASRAAHKLAGALDGLGVTVEGRRCLDAGASTGGFTDVLLRRGARVVVAVDIGSGQLAAHVAADPRVQVHDGTSIRGLSPHQVGGPADLLVADLSFISLRTVMGDLARLVESDGDLVLMVKPQFEVGRERLPRTGVVVRHEDRRSALQGVVDSAAEHGLRLHAAGRSPLPGQDGNQEYFVHLRAHAVATPVPGDGYDMIGAAMLGDAVPPETTERDEAAR